MRRAVALPIVLFTLALTSGLAVGAAFMTRRLVASAGDLHRSAVLESMAEDGLIAAVTLWDSTARVQDALGSTAALALTEASGVRTQIWITRASSTTYFIVAESRSAGPPVLRRRLGLAIQVVGGVPRPIPARAWSELP